MAYEITLTDSVDTMTISFPRPPLEERDIEGAVDVTTLDMNVYTDFFAIYERGRLQQTQGIL
jgi:hypothetical protein